LAFSCRRAWKQAQNRKRNRNRKTKNEKPAAIAWGGAFMWISEGQELKAQQVTTKVAKSRAKKMCSELTVET